MAGCCASRNALGHGPRQRGYALSVRSAPPAQGHCAAKCSTMHARWSATAATPRLVKAIAPDARTVVITPGRRSLLCANRGFMPATRQQLGPPTGKRFVAERFAWTRTKATIMVLKSLGTAAGVRPTKSALRGGRAWGPSARCSAIGCRSSACKEHGELAGLRERSRPAKPMGVPTCSCSAPEDPAARGVEGFGMVFLEAWRQACQSSERAREAFLMQSKKARAAGWCQDDVGAKRPLRRWPKTRHLLLSRGNVGSNAPGTSELMANLCGPAVAGRGG